MNTSSFTTSIQYTAIPVIVPQSLNEAREGEPAQDQEDEPPETSSGLASGFSSIADT